MKNEKCVKHSLWVHYVESPHSTIAFKGVKTIFTYNRWLTRRYLQVSGEDKITMLHLIQELHMTTSTFVASILYLGDSSPVSSSPSTPTRRTVSSIPAVWYLSKCLLFRKESYLYTKQYHSLTSSERVKDYKYNFSAPADICPQ